MALHTKDLRDRFFTQRVVNIWNKLAEGVVRADDITMFKRLGKTWNNVSKWD